MYKLPFYLKLKDTHFFISECSSFNNKRKPKMCVQIGGFLHMFNTVLQNFFGDMFPIKTSFIYALPYQSRMCSVFCVNLHLLAAIPNTDLVKNIWSHRKLIKDSNVKKHTIKYNNNITWNKKKHHIKKTTLLITQNYQITWNK